MNELMNFYKDPVASAASLRGRGGGRAGSRAPEGFEAEGPARGRGRVCGARGKRDWFAEASSAAGAAAPRTRAAPRSAPALAPALQGSLVPRTVRSPAGPRGAPRPWAMSPAPRAGTGPPTPSRGAGP